MLTDWKAALNRLSGTKFLPRSRKVSTIPVFFASVSPEMRKVVLHFLLDVDRFAKQD